MKGRALGIYEPSEEPPSKVAEERRERLKPDETFGVRLLGRTVPVIRTPDGIRAMEKDFRPASAASVERYLASKFGDHLDEVRAAMEQLAASLSPEELNRRGFALYEAFRPAIPAGARAGVRRANSISTGSSASLVVSRDDRLGASSLSILRLTGGHGPAPRAPRMRARAAVAADPMIVCYHQQHPPQIVTARSGAAAIPFEPPRYGWSRRVCGTATPGETSPCAARCRAAAQRPCC